jgi:phage tail-like protein
LVLKRGLLINSALIGWVRECIEDYNIQPRNIVIKLLNEEHQPLLTWHVVNAFPTKWAVSDLNAANNAVAVESMQLFYQYFTMDKG